MKYRTIAIIFFNNSLKFGVCHWLGYLVWYINDAHDLAISGVCLVADFAQEAFLSFMSLSPDN